MPISDKTPKGLIFPDFQVKMFKKRKKGAIGNFLSILQSLNRHLYLMGKPAKDDSTNELWNNYLNGDKSALEKLIYRYNDRVFLFLIGKTNDREIAKEVVQETWLKMVKHKGSIKNFKAYLYTVASNVCADIYRKNSRIRFIENTSSSINGIGVRPDVLHKLGIEDIAKLYRSCLTKGEFKLWELHCEGYNSVEISQHLSIEKKTVDNKKSIIRKKLIQKMKTLINN